MTRQLPRMARKFKGVFLSPAPLVLLPVPEQSDFEYPCTILKQIVRYFVSQTKIMDGLPLRHRLRLITDEQIVDRAIILTLGKAN